MEHVHARTRGRSGDEGALEVQPPRPRRGQLDEVGERACAALLCETEQHEQDLRRRAGIRERTVARRGRDAEEVRERREPHATRPPLEQASGKPHGVDDGRRDAPAGETLDLSVEEREVEPGVVGDERGVAREADEAAHCRRHRGRLRQIPRPDPGEVGDRCGKRHSRVHERLERVLELEAADALCADLADPRRSRREPGRLEVDNHEMRVLQQDVVAGGIREPDGRTAQRKPGVTRDDVVEERPGERRRGVREREQRARRLVDGNRAAPGFDELDQPVRRIEASCMALHRTRTYVRVSRTVKCQSWRIPGGARNAPASSPLSSAAIPR